MSIPINRALLTKRHLRILDKKNGVTPGWMQKMVAQKIQERQRFQEPGANFPVGQKKVYLPDFTVTLLRTPFLPATHAQFRVPLHFTKPDLRDYLFHAYNVRIHSVTSHISGPKISPKIRNPDPTALKMPNKRQRKLQGRIDKWMAKDLIRKQMIVHLEQPFVWPAMPTETELMRLAGPQHSLRAVHAEQEKRSEEERNLAKPARRKPRRAHSQDDHEDLASSIADQLRRGDLQWKDKGEGSPTRQNQILPDQAREDIADGTGAKARQVPQRLRIGTLSPRKSKPSVPRKGVLRNGQSLQSTFRPNRRVPDF